MLCTLAYHDEANEPSTRARFRSVRTMIQSSFDRALHVDFQSHDHPGHRSRNRTQLHTEMCAIFRVTKVQRRPCFEYELSRTLLCLERLVASGLMRCASRHSARSPCEVHRWCVLQIVYVDAGQKSEMSPHVFYNPCRRCLFSMRIGTLSNSMSVIAGG